MQAVKSGTKAPVAIWPDGPPRPLAPYTPAIKAAGWLFISGQLASDFKNGLAPIQLLLSWITVMEKLWLRGGKRRLGYALTKH